MEQLKLTAKLYKWAYLDNEGRWLETVPYFSEEEMMNKLFYVKCIKLVHSVIEVEIE